MYLKQLIASFFRKTGLIFQLDKLRYAWLYRKNLEKNKAFLFSHPGINFPEPYMIYETFRMDYERYYNSGRKSAEWIRDEVSRFMPLVGCSILDWGCGPGRVIRHMPEVAGNGCACYGTDYNRRYVDWCSAHLPGIQFAVNSIDPPLSYGPATMDLIYGISIFTHLSEQNHTAWFNELLRVLKTGGILFITTHGDITRENLVPAERSVYDSGGLVVRGQVKEGHRMFTAYQSVPYMKRLLGDKVQILKHKPGEKQSWGYEQDLWILRKV